LEPDPRPSEEERDGAGPRHLGGHDGGPPAGGIGVEQGEDRVTVAGQNRALGLGQCLPRVIAEAAVGGGHEEDAASLERSEQLGRGHQIASHSSDATP
jgi:hypothetical protein